MLLVGVQHQATVRSSENSVFKGTVYLNAFFEVFGGAQMAITFASRQPKGERIRSTSLDIEPQTGSPATLVLGEISIGGTIRF